MRAPRRWWQRALSTGVGVGVARGSAGSRPPGPSGSSCPRSLTRGPDLPRDRRVGDLGGWRHAARMGVEDRGQWWGSAPARAAPELGVCLCPLRSGSVLCRRCCLAIGGNYWDFRGLFSHAAPASLLFARGPGPRPHVSGGGVGVRGGSLAPCCALCLSQVEVVAFSAFFSIASCAYGGDWGHVTAAVVCFF